MGLGLSNLSLVFMPLNEDNGEGCLDPFSHYGKANLRAEE